MNPLGRIRALGAFTIDVLAALGHNAFFFLDLVKNSPGAIRRVGCGECGRDCS